MDIKEILKDGLCFLILVAVAILVLTILVSGAVFLDKITTESSEPVVVSAPETSSQDSPLPSPTETETTIETAPADDYIFYDVPLDLDTQKEIIKICSEFDLKYELILGVISVETDFRPKLVGDGGDSFGLMQIQPKWWSEVMSREGVTDLLDPLQNIRCGCAIITELINKYGTEYRALQVYNTGRPNTKNGYADKVYRRMDELTILSEG